MADEAFLFQFFEWGSLRESVQLQQSCFYGLVKITGHNSFFAHKSVGIDGKPRQQRRNRRLSMLRTV